jgi:hypothetical protein
MLIRQVHHDSDHIHDFSCMSDSGRKIRLRLYILTLVVLPDFSYTTRFWSMSRLWLHIMAPTNECAACLTTSDVRLHMAGLDDCNILQPRHLVQSRLGGTHDSISIQNLRSHSFTCRSSQAMSRATKENLVWRDLRQTRVSGGTWYPTTLEDQCLRMSGQTSLGSMPHGHGTKN